ncbi:MAG: ATP-binding protein [Propionivibrio sp.]|nr:ATP-binding protein [Propionivibrio sp.]
MESYPGPLGQVLSNLINNAVIHAYAGCDSEHGEISIEARLLENDWVVLTVADKGEEFHRSISSGF